MSISTLLNSGVNNKNWLKLNADSVSVRQLDADIANIADVVMDDISANLLTLNNQVGVPNAPVNSTTFFSSGQGNLSQVDELGAVVEYLTVDSGPYVPISGSVAMTGNLNMGTHDLTNVNNILTTSPTVTIGNSNTNPSYGSVCVGANNTVSSGALSLVYGYNNNMGGSANGQNIVYGNNNTDSNSTGGSFIYGFNNTNGTGSRNMIYGRDNKILDGVNDAVIIGFNGTNSTSNSVLFQNATSNIRSRNNNTCDLGVLGTNQFNNVYANNFTSNGAVTVGSSATSLSLGSSTVGASIPCTNTSTSVSTGSLVTSGGVGVTKDVYVGGFLNVAGRVDSNATLSLGTSNATALSVGKSGINTTINGQCLAIVPYGAWYCTATYSLAFTAGVNRLIPPVASSNGPQVDFSFAAGVLTYTGSRTNRVFQISYNINYNMPPSGGTMTFFNSKNGNLVLSAIQARAVQAPNTTYTGLEVNCCFTDNVVLSTGDTVQLAASCATSNTVTFNLNSCNIVGLLN